MRKRHRGRSRAQTPAEVYQPSGAIHSPENLPVTGKALTVHTALATSLLPVGD